MNTKTVWIKLPALVVLFGIGWLAAQEPRGTLLGRVTDTSGAVVPGASVTITNTATGIAMALTTNENGNYQAPYLLPGPYRIAAEKAGFKRLLREGIELRIDDRLEVNLSLEVGQQTESISVTADAGMLDTATASMGQVVDSRRVADLPLPHGDPYRLISLSPGITMVNNATLLVDSPYENTQDVDYGMGGVKGAKAEIALDGVSNTTTDSGPGRLGQAFSPPADAVAEFKIQTVVFDASLGQTEGGVINVSMKSGANIPHGTASWAKMFPSLTANSFFANRAGQEKTGFDYNRWGATFGGPIFIPRVFNGRNKSFFMWGYEGIHTQQPRGNTYTVPTAKEKQGDFSDLLKVGSVYQVYNPFTRRALANGRFQSDPFPGNIIPQSLIDPVARKALEYYPLPTAAGTIDGLNNYPYPNLPENTTYYAHFGRIDHYISARQRIFVRGNIFNRVNVDQNYFGNLATSNRFYMRSVGGAFDDVYTISPTFVVNVRAGYTHVIRSADNLNGNGFDLTTLGFPASYNNAIDPGIRRFPRFIITNFNGTRSNAVNWMVNETRTLVAAFDKIAGSHALKFGTEYRLYPKNLYNFGHDSTGIFSFDNSWTRGPLDNSPVAPVGQALAAMLLGLPAGSSSYVERRPSFAELSTALCGYVHDDWKVTRRLTLNIGIRYEVEGPLTERFNRAARGLDYGAILPIEAQVQANYAKSPTPEVPASAFRVRGGLTFAGLNGMPRTIWERDTNNFMPRFGLAYAIDKKTLLRGGYGIFFGFLGERRGDLQQTGYTQRTDLITSDDNGLTYRARLSNPFPNGIKDPVGATLGTMTNVGQDLTFLNTQPATPYNQKWQLSVQRELPGRWLIDAGYVGNRGTQLEISRNLDALPIQYLSRSPVRDNTTINYLSANLPNPFSPALAGTSRGGVNIARSALLTAYPQFTSLTTTNNQGYSWYHSLQTRAEKRFTRGYSIQVAYTWSKFREATSYLNGGDPMPERVVSDQDYPHRFVASWIWELPFGKGRRWAASGNAVVERVVSGWQVQGIYTAQSGQGLAFGNYIVTGDLRSAVLPVSERTVDRWFRTDVAFDRDTTRQLANNYRVLSSRFGFIRSDGINMWDLSFLKNTRITERFKGQFRLEALNALNHPMFAAPNTNPYNSAYGTVTATKALPRRLQVSLKVQF
jgi:hypothetical protein